MLRYHQTIASMFSKVAQIPEEQAIAMIEFPPEEDHGDRGIPCFRFAKAMKKSPDVIAKEWAAELNKKKLPKEIDKIESAGGYVNFHFNLSLFSQELLKEIFDKKNVYGKRTLKDPPKVIVEFSSPNIAKPFSIGHLRSTNLGACLSRIFEFRGYDVVRINHLGDWGTQSGKLIVAYRRWGSVEQLEHNPIQALFKLYVKFHEEEAHNPTLTSDARESFSKLEQNDPEVRELWEWFRQLTLNELESLYNLLSVHFDHYWGESFYISRLPQLLKDIHAKKLSKDSEGALVVDLKDYNLGVALLRKGDESSLYLTRDLAAAIYRHEKIPFSKMLYVVGAEQRLHFQQFFKILELLGHTWVADCEHIAFGQISFGDERMSTRKGNIVFLTDVLEKATEYALDIVKKKNEALANKEEVAQKIGLGAILFADISAKRIKNMKFSWDEILSFEGETGPYLQYSLVRTRSLLRRFEEKVETIKDYSIIKEKEEHSLVRTLSLFPLFMERAEKEREPFIVGQYLIQVCKSFNRFYNAHRILDSDPATARARILLVKATEIVLNQGMEILGIPTLEQM